MTRKFLPSRFLSAPIPIWGLGLILAGIRIYAFVLIHRNHSHDAMWQFDYWPLWVSDFPITILYLVLPIPFAEKYIGPFWWLVLPSLIWALADFLKRPRPNP